MADEFSKLQNVSLISESDLRDDVAANIEAKSSKESIADQTLVKNAWRAFQEAEELVNNLHGQLRTAEVNEANKAIGVTNIALHTESDKDERNTSQTVLSAAALRFKHNAALRVLDKKGEKLRQIQREVEERQRRRLEEIRSRQRTEAIHEQMRVHSNDGNMDTTAMNTMHEESGVNVESSPSPAVVNVQDGRQHHIDNNNESGNTKSDALQRNQVKSHEHTARPQRVFGTTMTSYSGGAVLPSLNRVLVSRADIQAKHLRYEDDADIALYAARLRKRKKLEKANALLRAQRRHDQAIHGDEMQSSQTSSEFTDFTDTQSIITSASTNTNTTTTANTDMFNVDNVDEGNNNRNNNIVKKEEKITNVKRENESHDQRSNNNQFTNSTSAASAAVVGAEKMHKVVMNENENSVGKVKMEKLEKEEELLEHQLSKQAEEEEEAKDDNPITAIDIDALMEEEEDVGDDLVQKLLAEQQQQTLSSLSLSESRTHDKEGKGSVIKREGNTFYEEEQEEEKELMESTEAKTRHSSKDTHPIDYSHITLKPERQVEIIPGIKISARIYRRLFPYQQDGLR